MSDWDVGLDGDRVAAADPEPGGTWDPNTLVAMSGRTSVGVRTVGGGFHHARRHAGGPALRVQGVGGLLQQVFEGRSRERCVHRVCQLLTRGAGVVFYASPPYGASSTSREGPQA